MAEYIEREAVMLQINIADFVRDDNYEAGATLLFQDDVVDRISSIPAADVRPVVRGKWKVSAHKTYYDVSCSVCGINSFFQVDEKDSVSYANYCPNCGADMRPTSMSGANGEES